MDRDIAAQLRDGAKSSLLVVAVCSSQAVCALKAGRNRDGDACVAIGQRSQVRLVEGNARGKAGRSEAPFP